MSDAPRYRLAPIDRTGHLFGLDLTQLLVLGSSTAAASATMLAGRPLVGLATFAGGSTIGAARWRGAPVVRQIPDVARRLRLATGEGRWTTGLLRGEHSASVAPALRRLSWETTTWHDAGGRDRSIVVTRDAVARTISSSVRVAGAALTLAERDTQDLALAGWGSVLQALVAERPRVHQLRWSVWSGPVDLRENHTWIDTHRDRVSAPAAVGYDTHLARQASALRRHEILLTLSVADTGADAVATLGDELRILRAGLRAGGLHASEPLTPAVWQRAMRLRLAPTRSAVVAESVRRGGALDLAAVSPLSTIDEWTSWRADDTFHRGFYIAEWPRSDIGPTWLADLFLDSGGAQNVTVVFEPVPRSESRRAIARDAAKIASDVEHRAQRGFRVGAWHRRATQSVDEREAELVAGHAEIRYAGVITLAAPTEAALDARSEELQQRAGAVGLDLRPLHGQHDLAVCVGLPTARGFASRSVLS